MSPAPALLDFDRAMALFDPALGLEVHVELNTRSKMFCGCSTEFGAEPNSQTCPVCLGLPGSLPVLNRRAVESAIRIGLALNCSIASQCRFARKNYFYPDMPKDFQTSQYDEPICHDGRVTVEVEGRQIVIEIERAHMEEDAGKLVHVGGSTGRIQGADHSLLDYNRAGVPLVEIVTKPILGAGAQAPQVARAYVAYLRDLLRALGVSDVRMEQGSLRCDANVSLMPRGATELGTRTETKNVNSLRSIERALRYEIRRQAGLLVAGGRVKQETRHWHEDSGTTSPGRSKEQAEDYRYFPEPDLAPVAPDPEWVERLRLELPEAPPQRAAWLRAEWGFTEAEMRDVTGGGALDLVVRTVAAGAAPAAARKWWTTELARWANSAGVELEAVPMTAEQVAEVQALIDQGVINDRLARRVFEAVLAGQGDPAAVVRDLGLAVLSDGSALRQAVQRAIADQPEVAQRIRQGKVQAVGALIGQVMRDLRGRGDAAAIRQLILDELTSGQEAG
ncbi:MAG: Asp-tRNA(Asn)/Glu-tRNA(Gln) amidotransferase subunit GatB [Propionibacteriaceae bacterium]|jgi:aspartyl-tRNA(Asn)/glutamyl-tRNA(Gln) amidotransferase subunit B|nr:Asp-tRNA(Asn)/Glu-tRNA(Gln) amidotransferase subunit GatB [Propionibacteriaceae bacterium]